MTKENLLNLWNCLLNLSTTFLALLLAVLTIWMPNSIANSKLNEWIKKLNSFKGNQ